MILSSILSLTLGHEMDFYISPPVRATSHIRKKSFHFVSNTRKKGKKMFYNRVSRGSPLGTDDTSTLVVCRMTILSCEPSLLGDR